MIFEKKLPKNPNAKLHQQFPHNFIKILMEGLYKLTILKILETAARICFQSCFSILMSIKTDLNNL